MRRTDLHSHILPSIDCGPDSVQESLEMVRLAAKDGAEVIVATPHFRDVQRRSSSAEIYNLVTGLYARLQRASNERDRSIRLVAGMENRIDPELPDWIDQGKALPLGNTKFVLVSLPFTSYPDFVDEVLGRIRSKRLVPIIAHPERNEILQRRPRMLKRIIQDGALTLATGASFTGGFGPRTRLAAEQFLKRGLLHAVASNMHAPRGVRSPQLTPAFERVKQIAGPDTARDLFETSPDVIIQGHSPDTWIKSAFEPGPRERFSNALRLAASLPSRLRSGER